MRPTYFLWPQFALLPILLALAADHCEAAALPLAPLPTATPIVRAASGSVSTPIPQPPSNPTTSPLDSPQPAAELIGTDAVAPSQAAYGNTAIQPSARAGYDYPCRGRVCCSRRAWWGCGCTTGRPFGTAVQAHVATQVLNGFAARMVLYHYDFLDPAAGDTSQLSLSGQRRLQEIIRISPPSNPFPIVVESTLGNARLDAARQAHVIEMLARSNVSLAVIVGIPPTGRRADEALKIHENLLRQVESAESIPSSQNINGPGITTTSQGGGTSVQQ